nr:hypothetical protein [Ensifer sp. IC4062]
MAAADTFYDVICRQGITRRRFTPVLQPYRREPRLRAEGGHSDG